MSVYIIPTTSYAEAQLLAENPRNCNCRRNVWRGRVLKEFTAATTRKEPLIIDLGPFLKDGRDEKNPVAVFINCGSVPVEEKRFWDVTVINTDRARRGQQYKTLSIDEGSEELGHHSLVNAFRIRIHPRNVPNAYYNEEEEEDNCSDHAKGNSRRGDNKKLTFRILFQPKLPNIVYSKVYFLWVDNVPLRLRLRGFSLGPEVCLSKSLINFGGVYLGHIGKRVLELHNHSLAPARFQFQTDNSQSTFKMCPLIGVIQPLSSVKVDITFHPFAPRSFYKRMYCLIHHQEPLLFDCFGISVPLPRFLPTPISFAIKMDPRTAMPTPVDTFEDFIEDEPQQRWGVKFDVQKLDFGYRDPDTSYPDDTSCLDVQAISTLPYDTVVEWAPDTSRVFSVIPDSFTLPANGVQTFSVNFKPNFPGAFYYATLECYIYPASDAWEQNRPPWELNKPAINNQSQQEPLLSKTTVDSSETKRSNEVQVQNLGDGDAKPRPELEEPTSKDPKPESPEESMEGEVGTSEEDQLSTGSMSEGLQMKVTIARLNQEECVGFLVAPVTDKIYVYDLPEMLMSEEEINPQLLPTNTVFRGKYKEICGILGKNDADIIPSQEEFQDTSNAGNLASGSGELSSGFDQDGLAQRFNENEGLSPSENDMFEEETNASNVQSISPSNILIPGAGQGGPFHEFFDGPKRVDLPLCTTLKVAGHSFTPQRVPFIPNFQMPSKAVMGATTPSFPIGRTFLMKNLSDLPCLYEMDRPETMETFKVRPYMGIIAGNQYEIIAVQMHPNSDENKLYKDEFEVNFNLQDNCLLGLTGYCEPPSLHIKILNETEGTGGDIICPITMSGCVTYTFVELFNPTGFHYRFWIEPADLEEENWMIIAPLPSQGFVGPNESVTISWKFAPRADGAYYLFWRFCFQVTRTCRPKETGIGFYEFILPVTGVAKTSYLVAEPSILDFDLIQIFNTKSLTTQVTNDGECPVTAHFVTNHEQWLTNFPSEMVTVTPSRISLQPHETIEITITVRPSKTVMQHFYIVYNFEFDEDVEFVHGAVMDVFDKNLIDIYFMGDHTIFKITDILMDSPYCVWDAQQCWSMFSLSLLNQLLTPHHSGNSDGNIPHVSSVSFRFPSAPVNTSNCIIKLQLNNVSDLKGYWAIYTKPPATWKRYLHKKLCHTCETPVFKDDHYRDTPSMASHLWGKKFGGAKKQSISNNPEDLGHFEITPVHGSLKAKEAQVITLKYSYKSIGVHDVSVLLRIFPAIYVWLDLTGITLDENQPYLQLMEKKTMQLHSVSLSDLDPPVQMFWIYNGGNTTASFTVDLEPFEQMKDHNFGHAIMSCLTPEGDVPSKSWAAIKLKFSPLEYTHYSTPLIVHPNYDKSPTRTMIHGSATIDPAVGLRPAATSETVRRHVLFSQVVPVTLSPSHVNINHLIPTGHSVTRAVFLTNLHSKNSMKYSWENLPIEGGGMITFIPNSGRLAPKEEAACKIIIKAGDTTTILSTMIACTIEDDSANVPRESSINPSTIDHVKLPNNPHHPQEHERALNEVGARKPESFNRLLSVSLYIGSVFGQYDNIALREKTRMGFVAPFSCESIANIDTKSLSPFTVNGSQLCQSVIRDMIWDTIQSPCFEGFIRQATKCKAPMFEEYAEDEGNIQEGVTPAVDSDYSERNPVPLSISAEIMEQVIFNMMHEMAERYGHSPSRSSWFNIPALPIEANDGDEETKQLAQN